MIFLGQHLLFQKFNYVSKIKCFCWKYIENCTFFSYHRQSTQHQVLFRSSDTSHSWYCYQPLIYNDLFDTQHNGFHSTPLLTYTGELKTSKVNFSDSMQSGEKISLGDSLPMGVFFLFLSARLRMPSISLFCERHLWSFQTVQTQGDFEGTCKQARRWRLFLTQLKVIVSTNTVSENEDKIPGQPIKWLHTCVTFFPVYLILVK